MKLIRATSVRAVAHACGKRVSAGYLRDLELRVRWIIERDARSIGAAKTLRIADVRVLREFNAGLKRTR